MIRNIFRKTRRVDGRRIASRSYYLRYRVGEMGVPRTCSLETSDVQVAEKRAREIIQEAEQEQAGILAPRAVRGAAKRALGELVDEYKTHLETKGNEAKYCRNVRVRLLALASEAGWSRLGDISVASFEKWRTARRTASREQLSAKTLNDYLSTAISFLSWAERLGLVMANPLRHVERVTGNGRKTYGRRALNDEELRALITAGGEERGLLYFFAARTGIRRKELASLTWRNIQLDGPQPCVVVAAHAAKNRKAQPVPLVPELVERLRAVRPAGFGAAQRAFPCIPKMPRFLKDVAAAGIMHKDASGAVVDFHALRYTWNTFLHCQGVSMREAQALMRHR